MKGESKVETTETKISNNGKGMSLRELFRKFPDDAAARAWFEESMWNGEPHCPHCGSINVQSNVSHPTMTHRCRDCPTRPFFSVRTGSVMEDSRLGCQVWAIAIHAIMSNPKGVSSLQLSHDLGITQKSAWHLAHRIRLALESEHPPFQGPVEVDETYVGGRRMNMPWRKKQQTPKGGTSHMTPIIGVLDRKTRQIATGVPDHVTTTAAMEFIEQTVHPDAMIYTDSATTYDSLPHAHESVNHSGGQYVDGDCHTNSIESFWSLIKRAHKGIYHKLSPKHLHRYATEFEGRYNTRGLTTLQRMVEVANGMVGKRLRYRDLARPNGRSSYARGPTR